MPPAFAAEPPTRAPQPINTAVSSQRDQPSTPDEPPPDYEEAQAQAVEVSFEERRRRAVLDGTVSRSSSQTSLSAASGAQRPL